ncbi:polymorphic toxin type 23 domain-containing protein [Frigoriflavimonas asaccharolytica]|uniref:Bacterial toxin 23 domain-containing protein n=1 Tax=Frigoriflavimonas asaccharolytica TaxID=2735899 RepID=A0A8J8GD38_9FLAO|nr:polymorphic toxin type 23 domain-containing protein [Frigoriflavimonas asaccharolytica]NRS93745.1 hypothetical protein [Frigoriflavimonas asaccharolytica]
MSRTRIVKGNITKIVGKSYKIYSKENIENYSAKKIIQVGKEGGVLYGEPEKFVPKEAEIIESEYKLESLYVHNHIKSVANEMVQKFNADNSGIIYSLYKDIAEGKIVNPSIKVTKSLHSSKAKYDEKTDEILVWEGQLTNIENSNDRKIKLISWLTEAYGNYIDFKVRDKLSIKDNLDVYDYDLFQFDAAGESNVEIGTLESPTFNGALNINFPKMESEEVMGNSHPEYRRDSKARGGPNAGDYDEMYFPDPPNPPPTNGGPGDPPFNIGLKFSFSLGGGFSASLYAGISKQIKVGNDFGLMPSFTAAATYYGNGTPGTSPLSPNLFTLSGTPSLTLGYKTGNSMNMNLFNDFSGSGVNNPYEYAFTLGQVGVLSSGRVTSEYDIDGNRIKDPYNSHDRPNRNQILGAASIKIGNFMISSYNDIYKLPLFLGMDSDQYWSAGVNMKARISDNIDMAYAFDLYYGKSNNKNTYNLDKNIGGQNYDTQRLFDVLLNRGQESFSFTDANGNFNKTTKVGYGTFWPSNAMHNAIPFPDIPERPKEPIKDDFKDDEKFKLSVLKYKKDLGKYNLDMINYEETSLLKFSPTFHHLFVVYKEGSKEVDLERLNTYMNAPLSNKKLQDLKIDLDPQINNINDK